MTIRNPINRARGLRSNMQGRPSNFMLILTAVLIVAAVAAVFTGAAIGLGNHSMAVVPITVPDDYPTIQAAIDAAKPGDLIQVRPGTYQENITLDKAVTLTAESFDPLNPTSNNATIEGAGDGPTIMIPSGMTQMPTVRGFVIQGGGTGIQAQSEFVAEFNFLRDSHILIDYQAGSGGSNHDNVLFKAGANAIHLDQVDRPLSIQNDRILYSGEDAIEINLQETGVTPAPIEVDITDNMLIGNTEDGVQFVSEPSNPLDANRRFVIWRNVISNNTRAGIGFMPDGKAIEDYSGAQIPDPAWIYNNTFYGNDYGISGGGDVVTFNNIIAASTARGVWRVQGPQGSNAVVADTLFFGNTLDQDQSTLGAGNIAGLDPRFVALPNPGPDGAWQTLDDDFSGLVLRADSPAIDKGVTQLTAQDGEQVPPTPLTGFVGTAPDLGWREYGSPVFATMTPSVVPSPTAGPSLTPVSPTAPATATSTSLTATAAPTDASPTAPAPTGTAPASPTQAVTATPATSSTPGSQVSIQSLNPNQAAVNTTVTVTITGSGFENNASVAFFGAQGPAPQVLSVQVVNSSTILVLVTTANDGTTAQTWDVRVTEPGGATASLTSAFTVTP